MASAAGAWSTFRVPLDVVMPIAGVCDARFGAVRDAFAENLATRGEVGAAVTVAVDGRVVVDLWGGFADTARQRPWGRETLVNVFSVSKALTAVCALRLVERGVLDLDAPMGRLWPELAAADVTLRHVLSHRAGLPAVSAPLPADAMLDWTTMTAALAQQTPWWEPGTAHGYHVNTFGFLVGEVVRRAAGRTLGALLREEIAGPLGADVWIGLPAAEHRRVAEYRWNEPVPEVDREALAGEDLMRWATYFNPAGLSGAGFVNTAAWRAAELPSTNGHATARGVARFYAALAAGGTLDGVRLLDAATLALALTPHSVGPDRVLQRPSAFGLGFQLSQPERPLGPNPGAFGHFGAGGALGFCDPASGLAFGYVMNDMGPRWQNPRNRALVDAVHACL